MATVTVDSLLCSKATAGTTLSPHWKFRQLAAAFPRWESDQVPVWYFHPNSSSTVQDGWRFWGELLAFVVSESRKERCEKEQQSPESSLCNNRTASLLWLMISACRPGLTGWRADEEDRERRGADLLRRPRQKGLSPLHRQPGHRVSRTLGSWLHRKSFMGTVSRYLL